MITLTVCGSMLTSVAFGPENILLGFDSLDLSGPDILSGCFDLCSADEILQVGLIDLVGFVDVDGAPGIPVEAAAGSRFTATMV